MTLAELIAELQAIASQVPSDTEVYCATVGSPSASNIIEISIEDDDDNNPSIVIETDY